MATNNNIGVKDIIQLIGLIVLGAAVFIGATYNFGLVLGILIALGIILAAYGIVFLLVKLKQAEQNLAQMKIIEYLLLLFGYGVIIIFSGIFALHFINIEMVKKEQIKRDATASINEITAIREDYNKYVDKTKKKYADNIKTGFERMIKDKDSSILDRINGIDKTSSADAITKKTTEVQNILGDEDIINKANQDLADGLQSINSMDVLSINDVLSGLQKKKNDYLNGLKETSQSFVNNNKNDNVAEAFDYNMQYTEDLSNRLKFSFSDLKNSVWAITIPALIAIHLMILWVYLFSSRSRSQGVSGKDGAKGGFTW